LKITEAEVRYVAGLAHLRLSDAEVARMAREMDEVLSHMEKLGELDTKDVPPMAQVLFDADETATLRDDVEGPTLGCDVAVANAAAAGAGYFKIPRVIEK
jgi:aspartyl-tRNA(Asn)/glutamyl-tRNA(Gln) amidotransferase subunit C